MKADIYFKDGTPPWEASDEVNVRIEDDNWVTAEYKDNLYYYPMQEIRYVRFYMY